MIAIRDAMAPWLETRHRVLLFALASRLDHIRPTGNQLCDSTGLCRRSVTITTKDLVNHGLVMLDSKPGRYHVYTLNLAAIVALAPSPVATPRKPSPRSGVRNTMPDRFSPPSPGVAHGRPGSGLQPLGKLKVVR